MFVCEEGFEAGHNFWTFNSKEDMKAFLESKQFETIT